MMTQGAKGKKWNADENSDEPVEEDIQRIQISKYKEW